MTGKIRFTIIIPFLRGTRGLQALRPCLQRCLEQDGFAGRLEVRVVSNFADPELESALSALRQPFLFLDVSGERGVNRARNLGASRAAGELLLFLDEDCLLPDPQYLQRLDSLFRLWPDFSGLGGPYLSEEGASWKVRGYNSMTRAWARLGTDRPLHQDRGPRKVQNLLGGNICFRREIFSRGLRFNEALLFGGDETEFHRRMEKSGYSLGYSEELAVFHLADDSWRELFARARRQGRARARPGMPSRASKLRLGRALWEMIAEDPRSLPFSLLHFPLVFFPGPQRAPQLAGGIPHMGGDEKPVNKPNRL